MLSGRKFHKEHFLLQTFFYTTSSSQVIHKNVMGAGSKRAAIQQAAQLGDGNF